jgi:putative ABC transport system permease protein
MTLWRRLSSWLRATLRRSRMETDMEAELRFHLQAYAEDLMRKGAPREEALGRARREFGGFELTKEQCRDARGATLLESFLQDLRYGARTLRKSPAFTVIAVLTLALGIGASTAVFSVVDRLLFRSLPYPDDNRLISFGVMAPFESREFMLGPDFVDWSHRNTPFESMTAVYPGSVDCDLTEQNPIHLNCGRVDANLLTTLRLRPVLGRNFSRDDTRPNSPHAVLLSYGFWRSRFASDPAVVGKNVSIDGRPSSIIGVLPPQFEMPTLSPADLLIPLEMADVPDRSPNGAQFVVRAFARLKPGISLSQATSAMQPLFQDSLNYVPPQFRKEVSFRMRSLRDRQVSDARASSWMLFVAVLAVLLVACTNVANLLLARASGRQRELAVRAALGASRPRLVRYALTESLLLSVLGGVIGCLLAGFLLRVFVSIAPEGIPRLNQASVDLRVLLFALGIALVSGILFGLAPALHTPAPELLLGKEVHTTARSFLRHSLITAQIAVSLILLAAAGLLLRSLWNLQSVSLGLDAQHVISAKVNLAQYRYIDSLQQLAFFRDLQSRLQRAPGITSLALSDTLPPSGGMQATFLSSIEIPGLPLHVQGTGGMIGYRFVTPDYFSALGIPIMLGRAFDQADFSPSEKPVILSASLAKILFPSGDPLGKQFRFGRQNGPWHTIVGIAADVKNNGLVAPADPEFYLPWKDDRDGYFRTAHLIVRSPLAPDAVAKWIREESSSLDPTVPVTIEPMTLRVNKLASRPKFNAILLTLFAALGVLLAAIGIYGVVAFLVAQRTQEIGIRMALGASPRSVLNLILSHVARWLFVGTLLGFLGAWLSARLLESLLFGVPAHDPALFAQAVALLLAVAFLAAYLPARRATRVDPTVALRYE